MKVSEFVEKHLGAKGTSIAQRVRGEFPQNPWGDFGADLYVTKTYTENGMLRKLSAKLDMCQISSAEVSSVSFLFILQTTPEGSGQGWDAVPCSARCYADATGDDDLSDVFAQAALKMI